MFPAERFEKRERLQRFARSAYIAHVRLYVAVNTFLVLIWLVAGRGTFWPIWTIVSWGFAVVLQALATFTHSSKD